MMLAGQAFFRRVGQDSAHDAAQGRLRENVIANEIEGHGSDDE